MCKLQDGAGSTDDGPDLARNHKVPSLPESHTDKVCTQINRSRFDDLNSSNCWGVAISLKSVLPIIQMPYIVQWNPSLYKHTPDNENTSVGCKKENSNLTPEINTPH